MKKVCALCIAFAMLFLGCAPAIETRIAEYADMPITVAGLGDEFTVTPHELAQMKLKTVRAAGTSAKAGTVRITGPSLETFLNWYGYALSDIAKVRFLCSDQYKVVLKKETLEEYDIILGIADADGPLADKRRPLRTLIPGEESGKWAYGVIRIEFVLEEAA